MKRCLVLACAVILAAGCSGGGGATPAGTADGGTKTLRIAMIPKGTTHEFWRSVHAGAEKAAKELGGVEILWKGPATEDDRESQISLVQEFIVQKVDGICLAPLDAAALVPYVEESVEKKIPVVVFDSGLAKEDAIVSYVATDNRKGGELAAHRLAEVLGKQGNVIMLRYNKGSESTEQREEGFLETLSKDYPDIKVLSSDQYAGTKPEQSLANADQILRKYKDEVNGIFAVCEPNATGVLKALENLDLATKVKFVAFDPNAPLIAGLEAKKVDGIVLQDPVTMGYDSVMAMVKHLRGEKVEKRISTGEYVATPENMHDEQMTKLLKPEQH
ncbi:substrate-binding domain-containing protein [Planctellipticum variicoloris]|uniref:ABC transporter substrate-binding protein n=1 Tax=Planctellipticum variicoloris TaxID=3064265 RepID=UPI003014191B|nr:substrate-binding domain-containing protein [Planctomycetaceae bacterium SH412]